MIWIAVAGALAALLAAVALRIRNDLRWVEERTRGDAYFGLPLAKRRVLRAEVRRRSALLGVLLRPIMWLPLPTTPPSIFYRGMASPAPTSSIAGYEKATHFEPDERDVFVSTQMKCGTTWMQQVVYEVLSQGRGDLCDDGHRHLYALSPWIESPHSVSMEDAPRVGTRGQRIIKTHMPVSLCPYSEKARYVYVTRHPVACFASCVDFIQMLAGPLAPSRSQLLDWYCSDAMWWGPWPDHVEGWWQWSEDRPNVLFFHYEAMLEDLPAAVARVAQFLDVDLDDRATAEIVRKSGFAYMKEHDELFEMTPPNAIQRGEGEFFHTGTRSREKGGGDAERERILAYCRDRLDGSRYPAARFYPELGPPVDP